MLELAHNLVKSGKVNKAKTLLEDLPVLRDKLIHKLTNP